MGDVEKAVRVMDSMVGAGLLVTRARRVGRKVPCFLGGGLDR